MKVKIFRFNVCHNIYDNIGKKHSMQSMSTDEIEKTINNFIDKKQCVVKSIQSEIVPCHYHNNCGYNKIDIIYTICYD